jgi:hypothetical protein
MKLARLLHGSGFAAMIILTLALHAQPVTLTCQLRTDPTQKSQVTFDEAARTAFFREEGQDAGPPLKAIFTDTEITWSRFNDYSVNCNNCNSRTVFTLDRMTGSLVIQTIKVGDNPLHSDGDVLGEGHLDCTVAVKQF